MEHHRNIKVCGGGKISARQLQWGAVPSFLPEQKRLPGEKMKREKWITGKEGQHCCRTRGWAQCCEKGVAGKASKPVCAARDAEAFWVPSCPSGLSLGEGHYLRPGHALEHVDDQQGSIVLSHTLTILFVGLWAHMESPPSSKVFTWEVLSLQYFSHILCSHIFLHLPLTLHPSGFTEHLPKHKPRSCLSFSGWQSHFNSYGKPWNSSC